MTDPELAASAFAFVHNKMKSDLSGFFWDAFTALNVNGISGDYAEFGSAGATSIELAFQVISATPVARHLWAFDSFEGLPEPTAPIDRHPAFPSGFGQGGLERFAAQNAANGIPTDAYTAIAGFFEDSLPSLGDGGPQNIALAYVDCNMYSSTVAVMDFLASRLKHGMIVAFDDYYCWSPTNVSGERAALDEFLSTHPQWNFLRFKDPTWGGASFVVEAVNDTTPRRLP